jgi:hypothetical protein
MISASSLPRIFACPASERLKNNQQGHAAELSAYCEDHGSSYRSKGTEVHNEIDAEIESGEISGKVAEYAQQGTSVKESFALHLPTLQVVALGKNLDRDYEPYIHKAGWSPDDCAAGTPDGWHYDEGTKTATLLEIKSGVDIGAPEEHEQSMFYAACVSAVTDADTVTIKVIYQRAEGDERDEYTRRVDVDRLDLLGFVSKVRELPARIETEAPNPGAKQCRYCPAAFACPEAPAMKQIQHQNGAKIHITPETRQKAARYLPILKAMTKNIEAALIQDVIKNGPVDMGDGTKFGAVESLGNRKPDADRVYQVLSAECGEAVAMMAMTKSATMKSIGEALSMLPKDVEKHVSTKLEKSGAVTRSMKTSYGIIGKGARDDG